MGKIANHGDLRSRLRPVVNSFLQQLDYETTPRRENEQLWNAALAKSAAMGLPVVEGTANWKRLEGGYYYAHRCYPGSPLEVQVYVVVYTLFALCLDDHTRDSIATVNAFFPRFCAGVKQPTPLLEGWAQMMREAYDHWDTVGANIIVCSTLNMITSTIIEKESLVTNDDLSNNAGAWAYYMRNLDGLGDAFAVFTFPKKLFPDVSQYLEAVPEIARYIVLANDVISFYKEELQGEEDNYIHTRARYEKKDAFKVLQDVVAETTTCSQRIHDILADGGPARRPYAEAWRSHEMGYIDFHRLMGRYRLRDLGLSYQA